MSEILLETGNGEVEIVEFVINDNYYAINVLKVKGIIAIDEVTPMPKAPEEIAGLANVRGEMNTVIDLRMVLHKQKTEDYSKTLGLLCEFNESIVVFLVDKVEGIRRVQWNDIKQTNEIQEDILMIGSILLEERIIILLDFESITLAAHIGRGYEKQQNLLEEMDRSPKHHHIVVAEDSRAIGEMLKCALTEAGYTNIKLFPNGDEALQYIFELKGVYGNQVKEKIDLLITDIEMPILDGYTLTKSVKEDPILKEIPVIIFSSLISAELQHKGATVGADVQISKPSMKQLVEVVNKMLLK